MRSASKSGFEILQLRDLRLEHISQALAELGLNSAPSPQDILSLSDIYNAQTGSPQIWENSRFIAAYLYYFMPLNLIRLQAVAQIAQQQSFFANIQNVVEWGSGPGTAHIALNPHLPNCEWQFIEAAKKAQIIHHLMANQLNLSKPRFVSEIQRPPARALGLFSYSLCEGELPTWAMDCDSLFIIEPSTQAVGRKLMALREDLIKNGYFIWAPCTHLMPCPLLHHSKTDWCHMRTHWQMPDWFKAQESKLQIRNDSVTYSYLLAKKSPKPKVRAARVIGDSLFEKGKVRQAICRSSEREYLSWLKRDGEPAQIERGSLVKIADDILKKGNELRVTADHPVVALQEAADFQTRA